MHPRRLLTIGLIGALLALVSAPSVSLAYERRTIAGGKYDVVVGWQTEPAYVSAVNAAGIRISKAGTNPAEPVTGAEKTLKVEIRQGADARSFDLRAVAAQPGYYVVDILPTRAGDYVWTFTGSIGSDQVDEKFDTADGNFAAVQAATDLQFPVAAPDPAEINAELQSARAAAQSAELFGYLGVALGAIGILAAVVLWVTRPRSSSLSLGAGRATRERFS